MNKQGFSIDRLPPSDDEAVRLAVLRLGSPNENWNAIWRELNSRIPAERAVSRTAFYRWAQAGLANGFAPRRGAAAPSLTTGQFVTSMLDVASSLAEQDRAAMARKVIGVVISIAADKAKTSVRLTCDVWANHSLPTSTFDPCLRPLFDAAGYPGDATTTIPAETLRDWVKEPLPVSLQHLVPVQFRHLF